MQHQLSSYVTLPIPLRQGLSDAPINVFSGQLEASKPHQTPVFIYFGPRVISTCLIGAGPQTVVLMMAQPNTLNH